MWCPRCDQGEVVTAMINNTGDTIYICKECEATWFSENDIGTGQFIDFGIHMKSLGIEPLWSEITISN